MKIRRNGGVIGKLVTISSYTSISGVWAMAESQRYVGQNIWSISGGSYAGPGAPIPIDYLSVGGGGGGGTAGFQSPGGIGGAGGVAQGTFTGTVGVTYTITVGVGGAANAVHYGPICYSNSGATGGTTTMTGSPFGTTFRSNGGCGGGGGGNGAPQTGGAGTPGASPIGGPGSPTPGGITSSITGSAVNYGSGSGYGAGGGPGAANGGVGTPGTSGAVILAIPSTSTGQFSYISPSLVYAYSNSTRVNYHVYTFTSGTGPIVVF